VAHVTEVVQRSQLVAEYDSFDRSYNLYFDTKSWLLLAVGQVGLISQHGEARAGSSEDPQLNEHLRTQV